jgi:DNA-binding response OmpR family regulator
MSGGPGNVSEERRDFNVLVVDDEKPILDLVSDIIEAEGWGVKAMCSPQDALRVVKLHKFDALLLDVYMPELPGLLFHAKLKFLDAELARRTIFMSGHFDRDDLRDHMEKSAQFLAKPFEPAAVVAALRKVIPDTPRVIS